MMLVGNTVLHMSVAGMGQLPDAADAAGLAVGATERRKIYYHLLPVSVVLCALETSNEYIYIYLL